MKMKVDVNPTEVGALAGSLSSKEQYEAIDKYDEWKYHSAVTNIGKWPSGMTTVFYEGDIN